MLDAAGFTVRPLEYYRRDGRFNRNDRQQSAGQIHRCFGSPYLKENEFVTGVYNTSLIVDAFKPLY